jgi:hypothetical protein
LTPVLSSVFVAFAALFRAFDAAVEVRLAVVVSRGIRFDGSRLAAVDRAVVLAAGFARGARGLRGALAAVDAGGELDVVELAPESGAEGAVGAMVGSLPCIEGWV